MRFSGWFGLDWWVVVGFVGHTVWLFVWLGDCCVFVGVWVGGWVVVTTRA